VFESRLRTVAVDPRWSGHSSGRGSRLGGDDVPPNFYLAEAMGYNFMRKPTFLRYKVQN
jgi:hypothetical protein